MDAGIGRSAHITRRAEAFLIPRKVHWIHEAATAVDPQGRTATTADRTIG